MFSDLITRPLTRPIYMMLPREWNRQDPDSLRGAAVFFSGNTIWCFVDRSRPYICSNNGGPMREDFLGTGLIYSDAGNVADPITQAHGWGTYGASGPCSSGFDVEQRFYSGLTASGQANTNNYTIDSFNESAYTPISSITLTNLMGMPVIELTTVGDFQV